MTTSEILSTLDDVAEDYSFPVFGNEYFIHGDQKLTVFRDETHWALMIEVIEFHIDRNGVDGIYTIVEMFGNCILPDDEHDGFYNFITDDETNTFLAEDENYLPYLNPEAITVLVKDQVVPVIHDRTHYLKKGIEFDEDDEEITPIEFMRGLIPEYSDLFWVERDDISNKIPEDLPVLMTLRDWYHPDIAGGEKPGDTETFQQLAKVIETGDVSFYQPTLAPNTHWKNWEE